MWGVGGEHQDVYDRAAWLPFFAAHPPRRNSGALRPVMKVFTGTADAERTTSTIHFLGNGWDGLKTCPVIFFRGDA